MTSHSIEGLSDGGLREKIARIVYRAQLGGGDDFMRTPEEWADAILALSAATSDGWVLVPREADGTMIRAGRHAASGGIGTMSAATLNAIYRAMLSAAPERVEGGGMDSPSQSQPSAEKGPQPFSHDAPLSDGKGE